MKHFKLSGSIVMAIGTLLTAAATIISGLGEQKRIEDAVDERLAEKLAEEDGEES